MGLVPDEDAPEKRTITLAEAKAGLKLTARRVVLVISDGRGTPLPRRVLLGDAPATTRPGAAVGDDAEPRTIAGTFWVGDHVVKGATFRLRKDSGDGPLLTPENLGGKTALTWAEDHWVTGEDGRYEFDDLPAGKYFVELFGKPEADA